MSSNYQSYLDYLASFADSHTLAVEAERNIYPLFTGIKNLIRHYQGTISKFPKVQNELITFIEKLNFDDSYFDYYQNLLLKLCKIEDYLDELKLKQVPPSFLSDFNDFIFHTYSSTSLYNLEYTEEKKKKKINFTYEVQRPKNSGGCVLVFLLIITAFTIFSFTIIN
jgi:hypothetical protein